MIRKLKNNQKIKHETLKGKVKRADSARLKAFATNKLFRSLTVICSGMPASFCLSRFSTY